jgi:hypothetical protein
MMMKDVWKVVSDRIGCDGYGSSQKKESIDRMDRSEPYRPSFVRQRAQTARRTRRSSMTDLAVRFIHQQFELAIRIRFGNSAIQVAFQFGNSI